MKYLSSHVLNVLPNLEVIVFVSVRCEQVFGALDVIGKLRLCQLRPKPL